MRVLITGGFGFVGGRLAEHLVKTGHQVILGSRNDHFPAPWLPCAEVVKIEWDNIKSLEYCCNGVDLVIHAAGMNMQDCFSDPIEALAFNGLATARLVKAASQKSVRRIIYLSTAHVYASPLNGTITEETRTSNLHPYATSNLAGEYAILGAGELKQIEAVVLRMSNAFGVPAQSNANCWTLLVNDLCLQSIKFKKMILRSNGLQQRNFISMKKVCSSIECLSSFNLNLGWINTFNLGGSSLTLIEMAQLIQKRCELAIGVSPKLVCKDKTLNQIYKKLDYREDRLIESGLCIYDDAINEIDKLLIFRNEM